MLALPCLSPPLAVAGEGEEKVPRNLIYYTLTVEKVQHAVCCVSAVKSGVPVSGRHLELLVQRDVLDDVVTGARQLAQLQAARAALTRLRWRRRHNRQLLRPRRQR